MTPKPQRILITGSSGQIGTNLGLRLLDAGYDVHGIDLHPNPWTDRIPTTICDLASAPCSGRTTPLFTAVTQPVDLVVHLAALAKVHRSVVEPEGACGNVLMTHAVLEFCRHHNTPLIFSSSREVYGNLPHDCIDESCADFSLTASPYAAGKIAAEAFIQAYARCYGLRYLIFRLSNVYGRYDCDLDRMERVVPLFIRTIDRDRPVIVNGAGKVLDFTYIDDCVDGLRRGVELLLRGGESNLTVNIAGGEGHTLVELAMMIGEALERMPLIHCQPVQRGEVSHYIADISRARNVLGYAPRTHLREGIGAAIAWWKSWKETQMQTTAMARSVGRPTPVQAVSSAAGH